MKKTVGIALITLGLASCTSTNYLPCPAYSSNDVNHETEAIHENLTQEEYNELIACQNCDEID